MDNQFTKYEAASYLGELVLFKKEFKCPNHEKTIAMNDYGKVFSVSIYEDLIKLELDVFGNFYSIDKSNFETYCLLLKPEIISINSSEAEQFTELAHLQGSVN